MGLRYARSPNDASSPRRRTSSAAFLWANQAMRPVFWGLTRPGLVDIDQATLRAKRDEVAALRSSGRRVVVVTSGAIAAGLPELGMGGARRPVPSPLMRRSGACRVRRSSEGECRPEQKGSALGKAMQAPHGPAFALGYRLARLRLRCQEGRFLQAWTAVVGRFKASLQPACRYRHKPVGPCRN